MSALAARIRQGPDRSRLEAILEAAEVEASPSPEVESALIAALYDEHPGLRQAAMDVLGRLASERGLVVEPKVVERVITLAKDPSPRVRQEACVALAILRDDLELPGRIEVLRANLEDPVEYVRQEAAAALGDLAAKEAISALIHRLVDRDRGVRFEAALALATLGDPSGRPVLEEGLERNASRLDACAGLRRLGDPAAITALERIGRKLLLPWVDRLTIQATLYHLGVTAAAEAILERTHARGREERAYALALLGTHRITEGLPRLAEVARSNDPLADTAVRALGELGLPEGRAPLEALLADPRVTTELKADAEAALRRLPAPPAP